MQLTKSTLALAFSAATMTIGSPLEVTQASGSAVRTSPTLVSTSATTTTSATDPFPTPNELLNISDYCAIIQTGYPIFKDAVGLVRALAGRAKSQSDQRSCDFVSGNVNDSRWEYFSRGRNCNTTAEQKTFDAAVQTMVNYMQNKNVEKACFKMTHGGTWTGYVKIAASNFSGEMSDGDCLDLTYAGI